MKWITPGIHYQDKLITSKKPVLFCTINSRTQLDQRPAKKYTHKNQ